MSQSANKLIPDGSSFSHRNQETSKSSKALPLSNPDMAPSARSAAGAESTCNYQRYSIMEKRMLRTPGQVAVSVG
jgi:hypothetical protein